MNEVLKGCDYFFREKSSKFRLALKKFNFLYVQQSKVWSLGRQNSLKKIWFTKTPYHKGGLQDEKLRKTSHLKDFI